MILKADDRGKINGHTSPFIEMEMLIQYESQKPLIKCTCKWSEGINNKNPSGHYTYHQV
jgi:hypothetical protein